MIQMIPFNADDITLENWEPMLSVRKKPVIVHATQLNFPEGFEVTTMEGKVRGKPGDYLMIGVNGEKYPIAREIFEKTYDVVDGPNENKMSYRRRLAWDVRKHSP